MQEVGRSGPMGKRESGETRWREGEGVGLDWTVAVTFVSTAPWCRFSVSQRMTSSLHFFIFEGAVFTFNKEDSKKVITLLQVSHKE